jgi:hypothetical protein
MTQRDKVVEKLTQGKTPDAAMNCHARRTTRVAKPVRLKVLGESRVGTSQMELTSAVAVNCHGCLYTSRHDYRPGSWVTLEVANQQTSAGPRAVRGQVKFVRLPGSPRELYHVGMELETPANVWGIKSPPEDWLPYSDSSDVTGDVTAGGVTAGGARANALAAESATLTPTEGRTYILPNSVDIENFIPVSRESSEPATQAAGRPEKALPDGGAPSTSAPAPGKAARPAASRDELMRAIEKKLEQAVENAVATAVAAHLQTALDGAVKAIENASQEGIRRLEEHRVPRPAKVMTSARQGFLDRLKADFAYAAEQLRRRVEALLARTQNAPQASTKSAAPVQPVRVGENIFSMRLASGQVKVPSGGDVRYRINIDTAKMLNAVVIGSFGVSGWPGNDIAFVLAAESEFENWIQGREAEVLFATDKVSTGQLNVPITQPGTYVLAFNNRFLLSTPKTVAAEIELRYSTPR